MRKKNLPPKNARLPARQDSEENRSQAFNYSLKYLSYRARSVKEVYDYLLRKNFIEDTINSVLKKLIDLKFLNDEEFARQWIESRQKHKGRSKFILKNELRLKGLNGDIIESLLKEAQDILGRNGLIDRRKKPRMPGEKRHIEVSKDGTQKFS